MHLLTFMRIFNAAFGTRCIHVHLNASYFGCIFLACCILVHSLYKMHSCAFFVCWAYLLTVKQDTVKTCNQISETLWETTHTYTRKKPSGLKAKLTWTGMGWTGCGRAIRRAIRAPMCHYMSSKSSSNAYTSEHTRVNASAYTSECVCE